MRFKPIPSQKSNPILKLNSFSLNGFRNPPRRHYHRTRRTRDEKDGWKKLVVPFWQCTGEQEMKKMARNFVPTGMPLRLLKMVRIPVLANGNIRHMDDVQECLEETGVEGFLSAETLLDNPALFGGYCTSEWVSDEDNKEAGNLDQADLVVEYLKLCEKYPVPWRMIRSHVHKMLGEWFKIHPNVREDLNAQNKLSFEFLYDIVKRLRELDVKMLLFVKKTSQGTSFTNGVAA